MTLETEPLQKKPDAEHPYAWYYGATFMGFLTEAAYDERLHRYSKNKVKGRGYPASEHSVFLYNGKRVGWHE